AEPRMSQINYAGPHDRSGRPLIVGAASPFINSKLPYGVQNELLAQFQFGFSGEGRGGWVMVQMDSPYKLPIASAEKPRGWSARLLAMLLNASLGLALPVAL